MDVDGIVEMKENKPETSTAELVEDTMLVVLFIGPHCTTTSVSERAKRHNFSRSTKGEDALARKKERTDL